jgi:hypothetical protein
VAADAQPNFQVAPCVFYYSKKVPKKMIIIFIFDLFWGETGPRAYKRGEELSIPVIVLCCCVNMNKSIWIKTSTKWYILLYQIL